MANDFSQFCDCPGCGPNAPLRDHATARVGPCAAAEEAGPSALGTAGARAVAAPAHRAKSTGRRRHRRGKSVHRHRLSRRRRDRLARALQQQLQQLPAASCCRQAPRNDNEYLMSQYNEGLQLLGQATPLSGKASPLASPGQLQLADGDDDDNARRPLSWEQPWLACLGRHGTAHSSPNQSSPRGSVDSGCTTSSDCCSSSSATPDGGADDLGRGESRCPASPVSGPVRPAGCGVVTAGTDADFLRRNFEEEYTSTLTQALAKESREELIAKCLDLMSRLKELEDARPAASWPAGNTGRRRAPWDTRVAC